MAMTEDMEIPTPPPVRIPNAWRAIRALSPALEMLSQNPDLIGDDIKLALQSETPDALKFLDAQIAFCQHMRFRRDADAQYAKTVAERAKHSDHLYERAKLATIGTMQQLRIEGSYRAPAGTAWITPTKGTVHIPVESSVPNEYWVTPPKTINRADVGKAIDADPDIDWATRGNGGFSLNIRG